MAEELNDDHGSVRPAISVIIPLYNKAQSIATTLESVFSQTFSDYEVVIIDDGSTDGSADVVSALADPRIHLVRQDNAGVSAARNRGLQLARASYAAFLDADDLWSPDYLETLVSLIKRHPGAGLYGTGYWVSDGVTMTPVAAMASMRSMSPGPVADYFLASLNGDPPCFTSCICVDVAMVTRLGGFKLGIRHGEDLDLWARIALAGDVVYSPEPKAVYRTAGENRAMARMPAMVPWAFRDDLAVAVQTGAIAPDRQALIEEYCAKVDLYHAHANLLNPDRRALRKFLRGIKTRSMSRRRRIYIIASYFPVSVIDTSFLCKNILKRVFE